LIQIDHAETEEMINLVRHEMQPIASKSTDLNIEEKVLLYLKTLGIAEAEPGGPRSPDPTA